MCSVARFEACERDWKHPIYPIYHVARSITLAQTIQESTNPIILRQECLWIKSQSKV